MILRALVAAFLLTVPVVAQLPTAEARASGRGRLIHEMVMSGTYSDLPTLGFDVTSLLLGGLDTEVKPFFKLLEDLRAVSKGGGSTELLLDLSSPILGLNPAQIAELERCMGELKQAGVKTTAYLELASTPHYLVASFCDHVVMADIGALDFSSPALSVMFLKGAMDLLGVEMQVTRAGKFKGAVEPYVRNSMSPHLKAHYVKMLGTINDHFVRYVTRHRGLSKEKVRAMQKLRLLSSGEAMQGGLIDETVSWRGARAAMGSEGSTFKRIGEKEKKGFSFLSLLTGSGRGRTRLKTPSIAVIHLSGAIIDGSKKRPGSIVSGPTVKLIKSLKNDPKVRGAVIRVNSPGGSATASEAILLALRDFAAAKPTAVSMGEVAASGGYYVSMIGVPVYAEHGTITGSIGVFGMRPNVSGLAQKIGIHNELVGLDEGAGMADLFRPLGERQLARIQGRVDVIYKRFQDRIIEARKMDRDDLLKIAGGRVWSGAQAYELGLVDGLGGIDAAASVVRKKAGDLPLAHFPKTSSNPLDLIQDLLGILASDRKLELHLLRKSGIRLDRALHILVDALERPAVPRVWMMLPEELRVYGARKHS